MSETLEKLVFSRGKIKGHLTRFNTFLSNFDESKNISEVQKRLEKVELIWETFDTCQTQIESIDDSAEQLQEREQFETNYFDSVARAQDIIDSKKSSPSINITNNPFVNSSNVTKNIKLPVLQLTQFKGNYSDYTQFHDTFESLINQNDSLSNIQKFYYLKSCLQGDALRVIASLEVTDGNYEIAWQLLKERYDNKRIIINSHIKSIVEIPPVTKENSHILRSFLDTFLKDIRSLKNLGQSVKEWDTILIYLLSSKLDNATKREWELSLDIKTLPTVEDFSKFLNLRCHLLETMSTNSKSGFTNNADN